MPRLFTGIEIPEAIREHLARLRLPFPGAKWVAPEDLHITLRFAGDIDARLAAEFAGFLDGVAVQRFEIRLKDLGTFGGGDPRSLWAGVERGPELDALARANERAARAAGLAPSGRSYKPHVTLARLRHSRPEAVARVLEARASFRSEPFLVDRFVLFSSKPRSGGGPYAIEATYPLLGATYNDPHVGDSAW